MGQEILNLKIEGKDLREIGKGLGISDGIMDQEILNLKAEGKSLREIGKALGVSYEAVRKRLKRLPTGNDKVSTLKSPSVTTDQSVNPSDSHPRTGHTALEKVSQGVIPISGDLFGEIREFLEERGIEVYRIKIRTEAYQVKYNDQTIRLYVYRRPVPIVKDNGNGPVNSLKGDVTNGEKEGE
jgi:DNA-binding CsgD family transcriptional regulator